MSVPNGNGFREDELVLRKQKVNGEWIESYFPRVGGRLRLAHEGNDKLSIQTELIRMEDALSVVKSTVTTSRGSFCGYGSASAQRDQRLADSLLELAETRSIARALRFSGYGVEYAGAEEVSHVMADAEPVPEQTSNKPSSAVFGAGNGTGKPESKSTGNGKGTATQAQCRALYALTKRANYTPEDIEALLSPLNAATFQALTRESASELITHLQIESAA